MKRIELTDKYKQIIEAFLLKNDYCGVGILDNRRFFWGYRKHSPEILVLVNSSVFYGEVWGHVFWQENSWISCLAQITGWFSGSDEEELIEDYWENLRTRAGFTYLSPDVGDSYVVRSDSLDRAVIELAKLIMKIQPNAFRDGAEENKDLYEVYGVGPIVHGSLYSK
jgi:hypothetical protein